MPLYEFLRLAIEKLESSQQNPSSIHLSTENENDLSGRVPENVQITTQKQPDTPSVYDETYFGNSSVTARIEKSGGVEYMFNGISPELPSEQLEFSQKDETVPWLNYPADSNSLQDYSSSVSVKRMLARNSLVSRQNGSSCDQTVSDLDAVKLYSLKAHSWMHTSSDPSLLSRDFSNVNSKELFLDGKTKKIILENKASNSTRALDGDTTHVESIVASSSVSSGNTADERVSRKRKHNAKRNIEESECHSDVIHACYMIIDYPFLIANFLDRNHKMNLLARRNLVQLKEAVDQREAEQQKYIIFQKGGEEIGSTRKCVLYKNLFPIAIRQIRLQCLMKLLNT